MKTQSIHLLFLIIVASSLFSCKVYRNVENLQPKVPKAERQGPFTVSSLEKLVAGDKISVLTLDGKKHKMNNQQRTENVLFGKFAQMDCRKVKTEEQIEIQVSDIEELSILRKSPAATVSLVLGCSFGVILVLSALALTAEYF